MIILLLLLGCLGATAQISTPTLYYPQIFDVQHYEAAITFPEPALKTIVGDVSISVKWTASATRPSFPFHLRGLTIDSVFVNGAVSSATTVGSVSSDTMHHRVTFTSDVAPGQTDVVRVFYHGVMSNEGGTSPWGGVHYQDSTLYALGVGFLNSYVSTTQHWLACYDHPSDKATFSVKFTVPVTPWQLASVGKEIATREPWPDGFAVYRWLEDHPTSTYLLTFAVAPYTKIEMAGVVPHVFYTLPRDSSKSARSFKLVPRMTKTFAEKYGDYPFEKVGYCNTQVGAMEHQTMISFPTSLAQRADSQNVTAAHELAHQWFGDCVSPLDFRYAWLTESFATFSECVWLEEYRGLSVYLRAVAEKATDYIKSISGSEGVFALENFPRTLPSSNYPQTIYQKGAVVVAMMRAIAGDESFYSAMKGYQIARRYSTATTEDMKEALRVALNTKTDAFFAEWVTGIGWAQLNVDQIKSGSDVVVTIDQVQRTLHPTWPIFTTLPLNVVYTRNGFAGVDTLDVILYPDSAGHIEFTCTQLLSVNAGKKCRSLVEVLRTTYAFDEFSSISPSNRYTIAPNPANDSVQLLRMNATQSITLRVVNSIGETMFTQTCAEDTTQCLLDVSHLTSGSYRVVIDGQESISLPLVITRGE